MDASVLLEVSWQTRASVPAFFGCPPSSERTTSKPQTPSSDPILGPPVPPQKAKQQNNTKHKQQSNKQTEQPSFLGWHGQAGVGASLSEAFATFDAGAALSEGSSTAEALADAAQSADFSSASESIGEFGAN